VVSFRSSSSISTSRNRSLLISAYAFVSLCGEGSTHRKKSAAPLRYEWSVWLGRELQNSSSLRSLSSNQMQFRLPPYRLSSNSVYVVKLRVSHLPSSKSSSNSVEVKVGPGSLVCLLSTSSLSSTLSFPSPSPTPFAGARVGLRVDESLFLDLSRSYDEDVYTGLSDSTGAGGMLLFEWSCVRVSPSFQSSCTRFLVISSLLPHSTSQISVSVNASSPDEVKEGDRFSLLIRGRSSTSNSGDQRSCEVAFDLVVLSSESPLLKLSVVGNLLSSSETVKINPSSKLKVVGTVDLESPGEVFWNVSDPSIDLSLAQSPLSLSLTVGPSSSHVLSFVMPGNSLVDPLTDVSGLPFSFVLSLTFKSGVDGRVSSTSVTIKTNSPPSMCGFAVSPRVGAILETTFLMSTSRCVDEDLPLSYQFGYSSLSLSSEEDDTRSKMVVLRSKLELSHTSTHLPLGYPEMNFSLSCLARVFDSFDASRVFVSDVFLEKNVNRSLSVKEYLLEGLNQSSRDPDSWKNVVSLTTSMVSVVDCSLSPLSNCTSLNRKRCGILPNTCGECVSGHVGVSGPSNTPCLSLSAITRRRRLNRNPFRSSSTVTEVSCASDDDCEYGLFLKCHPESHLCVPIQQSCPNSCSGHGMCVFRSKYHRNVTVEECGVLDMTCVPVCECLTGYIGSSCSSPQSAFQEDREIRGLLLGAISEMMSLENPDRSSVMSWLTMLRSLSTDSSGLDDDSKVLLGDMCESLLLLSLELGLSSEDLTGADRVIDVIVSIGADLDVSSSSLLRLYLDFLSGDMLQGQHAQEVIAQSFRSSSVFQSLTNSTSVLNLSSPVTPLESLSHSLQQDSSTSKVQSISLPSSSLISPFKFSLLETQLSLQISDNASELSSQFGGIFNKFLCQSSHQEQEPQDCKFRVELINRVFPFSSSAVSNESVYFEVNCTSGMVEEFTFECPSGFEMSIACDGSSTSTGRRHCPIETPSAVCNSLSNTGSRLSPHNDPWNGLVACEVVSFDSSSTICECVVSPQSATTGSGNDDVQFSVQSIGRSVAKEFVTTWRSSGSLTVSDVRKSVKVLVTVASIGVFFLLMVLVSMQWDVSDQKTSETSSILSVANTKILKPPPGRGFRTTSSRNPHSSCHSLLDKSLPSVFKSESLWNKFNREIKVYHRWLGIVFYYSPEFPRAMRVLSLFSSIVIMLFIQSVTYNIADPDDGSCEKCENESCCLSLRSTLNSNEDRCSWKTQESDGSCHFRPISGDMERVFVVAILSAVISAPLSLAVQYLITNVLSPETCEALLVSDEMTVGPRKRVLSEQNSSSLRECCGDNLFHDLKNLVTEVSSYGSRLEGEKLEEYTGRALSSSPTSFLSDDLTDSWGLLLESTSQQQSPPQNKTDEVLVARSSNFLARLASGDNTHSTVQQNLAKELAVVRREVFEEYRWLKEGADRVYVNKDACLEAKRLRLLYLFVKDLSSGVSGEVLSKKAERDGVVSKRIGGVWWVWKLLGWLFVILMNLGMLLYVYLFALRQTNSRQLAWVQSFVTWLIFDLFIAGTGVVLLTHLLIPLYVMSDIRTIKRKVLGDIVAFQDRLKQQPQVGAGSSPNAYGASPNMIATGDEEFNSAKYLFASWRVAWLCREIPESQLILQFSTPWPKQSLKREKKKVTRTYEKRYSFIGQALSRVLIFFLTSLIHLPLMLQDLLIHFVSNSGLGYVILLILRLARIHPVLPVLAILMLGVVVHFLVKTSYSAYAAKGSSSVSPWDAKNKAVRGDSHLSHLSDQSSLEQDNLNVANMESGIRSASVPEPILHQSPLMPAPGPRVGDDLDKEIEEKSDSSSGSRARRLEWQEEEEEDEFIPEFWECDSDLSSSSEDSSTLSSSLP
jgi:hypothetical protein